MTLKQKLTIKNLPKNGYNISKSMRLAGYTEQTSRAGSQYNTLRKYTRDYFDADSIKRDIKYTYKLAKKEKDITNMNRNLEHQAKISGIIVDKTEELNKQADKVVIVYADKAKNITDIT
jgi:hypothetical protein